MNTPQEIELGALRRWAIVGQRAVELAAEALNVDNQDIDPDTVVDSLVYSEAVMETEAKLLLAEKDRLTALAEKLYDMAIEFDLRTQLSYTKEGDLEYLAALAMCNELFPDDEPRMCACGNHPVAPGKRVCEECAEARKLYPALIANDSPDETE